MELFTYYMYIYHVNQAELDELVQKTGRNSMAKMLGGLYLALTHRTEMVDFLIGHHTYRIFPPAIDIIPTLLAVVYSNGKYTN